MHSGDVRKWRVYFKSSNSSIFDVIENAILVAALDYPYEFKAQKDQIAFKLLTCSLLRCSLCEGEMSSSSRNLYSTSARESRVYRSNNLDVEEGDCNRMLENLAMEIEEDDETLKETMEIKRVLGNSHTQSDLLIEELLQKLHRMDLSIQILKATMIGATVTTLRKHGSKQIRNQARDLIWQEVEADIRHELLETISYEEMAINLSYFRKWRRVADEWVEAQETTSCELPKPHLPNNNLSDGDIPTFPECSPDILSKLFEDVDQKKFFSILPHDDDFAALEDLYIEQHSSERLKTTEKEKEVKLFNSHKRAQPNHATDLGKTKASECGRKGKSVVSTQHQLKQKTIERPSSTKLDIGDLGNRVTSEKQYQLERNIISKPQVGTALKANECRNVNQKPPGTSSLVNHQLKQNITELTEEMLALPVQKYIRKPKPSPKKRAQLSQSGAIHQEKLKASMEVDELKLERAGKRIKARYEELENGRKRRAVKVIDPEELKDLRLKQGKKTMFTRI